MALAVANVIGGPAKAQIGDADVGHTQGGIGATVTPSQHTITVDQFGSSPVGFRHTGDDLRVTVPFAQWDAATLAQVYDSGNDATGSTPSYLGIGRTAGYNHSTVDLKVIPFLTANVAKRLHVPKSVAVGALNLAWNNDGDTIFEVEFAAVIDSTNTTDGEYLAQLDITTS